MLKLNETELRRLIEGGETATVELKVAPPRPGEVAERLCGMANARGGVIVIGVEDNSLRIVGVRNTSVAVDVLLRAARQIQPALVLDPPEPEIYMLDGKQVVIATVAPSRGPLYQSGGVCWVRRGTHTVPFSVPEMMEVAYDRGLVHWEVQFVQRASLKDIDQERVQKFLQMRSTNDLYSNRFENVEQVLLGMECAKVNGRGEVLPTNAGVMFFGQHPQQFLPHSEVVCVLYQDELGVGKYLDRKIITGTLEELIDGTELFLKRNIAVGARIEGWKRVDLPEYPIEALREAVVNAVVHRDYSRVGESIRVFYYSDRIEIHSPGLLLPGITVEQMSRGVVMSKLRNPVLGNLLRDVPGYMERIGSGVRLMLHEAQRMGLQAPEFKEMSEFIVTFRKARVIGETAPGGLWAEEDKPRVVISDEVLVNSRSFEQAERTVIAMRYMQKHGSITNRKYRELTGVSQNTALRDLEALASQGSLKSVGKRRNKMYLLP